MRRNADHSLRRLVRAAGVDNSDAAIVRHKRECIAAWRESAPMHPSSRVVQEFSAHSPERQAFTPHTSFWTVVDTLDERAEDASMPVGAAAGEEHAVWVPCDGGNGAANGLLEVLGHPPVVLGLEIADGDGTGAATDGKFGLGWRPANGCGGAVEAEEDESGLPAGRGGFPDVCVSV